MKSIFGYTGTYDPVITNTLTLRSKSMINEDEYKIVDNEISNYDNSFEPGLFRGTSQVDVILSQTRIDLENVVNDTLITAGIFYKQELPIFQEIINSCSTKVQFDECMQILRN